MNIALHSSDLFAPMLSSSIISVLENNKGAKIISIYVIEHGITSEHRQMIHDMVAKYPNANLTFIPMPDINKKYGLGLKSIKSIWLFDSYCRLFLGSILPQEVERVLYLDCDTLCVGSLASMYHTDLGDNPCAGVADCLGEKYYELFGMSKSSRYCNSGIILFDLKKWREQKIELALINYVRKEKGYIFFMEQSVWNIVLQDRIKILHPRNNTYTLMVAFTYKNLQQLRKCKRFYSHEEIEEAIANPTLIHLTNCFYILGRAWTKGNKHPYHELYLKYKALTPWKDDVLLEDKTSWMRKALVPILHMLPQVFVCQIVGWVYNIWRPLHIKKSMLKNKMR